MSLNSPYELRCDYLMAPMGLDNKSPRFSWLVKLRRRSLQMKAYQILVASSTKLLEAETGDLWDSGKKDSNINFNAPYEGAPLKSHQRYFWTVRCWDHEDAQSPYAPPAHFDTGFFKESWDSQWITREEDPSFDLYFRKEFRCKGPIKRAMAYGCGLGAYELRLNGEVFGEGIQEIPSSSSWDQAFYFTYDITQWIKEENALGAVLGSRNPDHKKSRLILQVLLEEEDGTRQWILTDGSWKVSLGPKREFGLVYDARKRHSQWDLFGFDHSTWSNATVTEGLRLRSRMSQPNNDYQSMTLGLKRSDPPDREIYDLQTLASKRIRLELMGERDASIGLTFSNSPDQGEGESILNYILSGEDVETLELRNVGGGFRFLEVNFKKGRCQVQRALACSSPMVREKIGDIFSSNDLFNSMHRVALESCQAQLTRSTTICHPIALTPIQAEELLLNFDMAGIYAESMESFKQRVEEDQPSMTMDCCSNYISMAWLIYYYYNDLFLVKRHYKTMEKALKTVFSKFMSQDKGYKWEYCLDALRLSRMAEAINEQEDAVRLLDDAHKFKPSLLDLLPGRILQRVCDLVKNDPEEYQAPIPDGPNVRPQTILEILSDHGEADVAWELICSALDVQGMDAWAFKYPAGVSCEAPAWKKIKIIPHMLPNLSFVTSVQKTVQGVVYVSWKQNPELFMISVTIPHGSSAQVHLPMRNKDSMVMESDKVIWVDGEKEDAPQGIRNLILKRDRLIVDLECGMYKFFVCESQVLSQGSTGSNAFSNVT